MQDNYLKKYYILLYIYAASFAVYSVSALFKLNMDSILRMPFLNIRYIDFIILYIALSALKDLFTGKYSLQKNAVNKFIILFVLYEIYLLIKSLSFQDQDFVSVFAIFLSSISILSLFDLSNKKISFENIKPIIIFASIASLILFFDVMIRLFGLRFGYSYQAFQGRIELDVGSYEKSISNTCLASIVFIYSVNLKVFKIKKIYKYFLLLGIISLIITTIIAFGRGILFTWVVLLFYYAIEGNIKARIKRIITGFLFVIFITSSLGGILTTLGYNPLEKITNLLEFTLNYEDPGWDKGRGRAREKALNYWEENPILGNGYYNSFNNYLELPHNFFVSSLATRGIMGTSIITIIIVICYRNSIKLWKLTKNLKSEEKITIHSLIVSAWLWLIPLMTQEIFAERYSTSVQFVYLGLIQGLYNYYKEKKVELD